MQYDCLGKHSIGVTTECAANLGFVGLAFEPVGEEGGCDPITRLNTSDHGADSNYVSGTVGAGNNWNIYFYRVRTIGNHEVAVVQRHGSHLDPYFVWGERALDKALQLQTINSPTVRDTIRFHDCSSKLAVSAWPQ